MALAQKHDQLPLDLGQLYASDTTGAILAFRTHHGYTVWRQNTTGIYDAAKARWRVNPQGRRGVPDIIGFRNADGPMKRFAFIALHAPCWPMREQCRLLNISPSGYYAWRKRAPATAEPVLAAWQVAAQRVFSTHAGRYGQRRLRAQLRLGGHAVGRQWLTGPLHPRQHPAPAHHPGRPAGHRRR